MAKDFVSQHIVDGYDVHIRKLIPGYELVHQHILAILQSRFKDEKIQVLIVGCGTGYELGYLLECFPNWQFVATDLSHTMLDKAKIYVQPWNTENRVQFILGDCDIHQFSNTFDLVFSILVGHFVPYLQKANFFQNITANMKANAMFICFDLMKFRTEFDALQLKQLCQYIGLTEKQASIMLERLDDDFYPLSEQETLNILENAKFKDIARFIQIASYAGYVAIRS